MPVEIEDQVAIHSEHETLVVREDRDGLGLVSIFRRSFEGDTEKGMNFTDKEVLTVTPEEAQAVAEALVKVAAPEDG